jgi:hypothetical protein
MKAKFFAPVAVLGLLAFAGCESVPVNYPLNYQVPIGNSTVSNAYGPQNLNVSGVQDVPATPGQPLYYNATAPVNLTFYAFDKTGPGPGGPQLNQSQGTYFNGSVTPTSSTVEFVFSVAQANTGGTVMFTVSNHPLPVSSSVPSTAIMPPPPGTAPMNPNPAPATGAAVSVTPSTQ